MIRRSKELGTKNEKMEQTIENFQKILVTPIILAAKIFFKAGGFGFSGGMLVGFDGFADDLRVEQIFDQKMKTGRLKNAA